MASPHLRSSLSEASATSDNDGIMDQLGSVIESVETDKHWEVIGYIVAEVQVRSAAPYTRGSGPPMKPIGIMPSHDKDGIILDLTRMNGNLIYIVGYKDKPALHVGVRPANIMDYVSARTLENYETAREKAQEKAKDAKRMAKANPNLKASTLQKGDVESRASGTTTATGKARRRPKRKREEGADDGVKVPVSRKKQALGEPDARPSSSSSSLQLGLTAVSSESEFEKDDTAIAIARQLRGTPHIEIPTREARSGYASPERVKAPKSATTKVKETRSNSRQTRSTSATSIQPANNSKQQASRSDPRRGSVAVGSSVEAANLYEKLEKSKESQLDKVASEIEPDTFYNSSSSSKIKKASIKPAKTAPAVEPFDPDAEYFVEDIIDHKYEKGKRGKMSMYYYIKWAGDWPNSWEPAVNVGAEAIENYEQKVLSEKLLKKHDTRSDTSEARVGGGATSNGKMNQVGTSSRGANDMVESAKHMITKAKGNGASVNAFKARSGIEDDNGEEDDDAF